jgi:hypothetical protein
MSVCPFAKHPVGSLGRGYEVGFFSWLVGESVFQSQYSLQEGLASPPLGETEEGSMCHGCFSQWNGSRFGAGETVPAADSGFRGDVSVRKTTLTLLYN